MNIDKVYKIMDTYIGNNDLSKPGIKRRAFL